MSNKTLCAAFFVFSALCVSTLNAQTKATVKIKKSENGKTTEQVYDIELEEGEDIQKALSELGVLDEKGNLSPNEHFEIKINRFYERNNNQILPNLNPLTTPPSTTVKEVRPFLGILLKDTDSVLEINQVEPGGAADKAGLRKGDILTKVDDQTIDTYAQFAKVIQSHKIGDKITIHVLRNGKSKKFKATLGQKLMEVQAPSGQSFNSYLDANGHIPVFNFRFGPDSITILGPSDDTLKIGQPFAWNNGEMVVKEMAYLGVTPFSDSVNVTDEEGVKINVEPQTPAESMGIQSGDVITSLNGISIRSFQQLADVVAATQPEQVVDITVLRDGKQKNLTGAVGKRNCSNFADFRIFHDFRGMDEIGTFFYNYEFDMNLEDLERNMDELLKKLDIEQLKMEKERQFLEEELQKRSTIQTPKIAFHLYDLSAEDLELLRHVNTTEWKGSNDLSLESISFLPNISTGKLHLDFETTDTGTTRVQLLDEDGQLWFLEERNLSTKQYSNTIDLTEMTLRVYYLQITQNGKWHCKKIVVH